MTTFNWTASTTLTPARVPLDKAEHLQGYPQKLLANLDHAAVLLSGDISNPRSKTVGPFERPPSALDKHQFTLYRGEIERYPGATEHHESLQQHFAFREAADVALLVAFKEAHPDKLAALVPLDTTLELARTKPNPALLKLHALRRGEAGWSLDKYGCLGFCFVREEVDRAVLEVWYVKAEVPEGMVPLAEGNELPLDPLPEKPVFEKTSFKISLKGKGKMPVRGGEKEEDDDDEDVLAKLHQKAKESAMKEEEEDEEDEEEDEEMRDAEAANDNGTDSGSGSGQEYPRMVLTGAGYWVIRY